MLKLKGAFDLQVLNLTKAYAEGLGKVTHIDFNM